MRHEELTLGSRVFETRLGWMGIAWLEQGLVAVTLPQRSEAEALSQLPVVHCMARGPSQGLDVDLLVEKLERYFAGEVVQFDEPLDPRIGTTFQRRVWAITQGIPRGCTLTYGQIAARAGSPGAARAVGQAMARNPWPVIVPCHRVVGRDGCPTGFGGGIPMKWQMLLMEGALHAENLTPV